MIQTRLTAVIQRQRALLSCIRLLLRQPKRDIEIIFPLSCTDEAFRPEPSSSGRSRSEAKPNASRNFLVVT